MNKDIMASLTIGVFFITLGIFAKNILFGFQLLFLGVGLFFGLLLPVALMLIKTIKEDKEMEREQ